MFLLQNSKRDALEAADTSSVTATATSEKEILPPIRVVRSQALGKPSRRTAEVALGFGLSNRANEVVLLDDVRIPIERGSIVLITGPSGSGKSTALSEIQSRFAVASLVHRVAFPRDLALIDAVEPSASTHDAIALLTSCGLGDAGIWIRSFDSLSEGERFRARLARAIALQLRDQVTAPLLCDEFCSGLHRRLAKCISFNLRKIVTRNSLAFVAATSNEDVIADLQPDVIVRLSGGGRCDVEYRQINDVPSLSIARRLRIERGSKRDYEAFAAMHYRSTDELGFVDKVFVLRDCTCLPPFQGGTKGDSGKGTKNEIAPQFAARKPRRDILGIVVYSHAPLESSMRNRATDGWFVRNPRRVNQQIRILRRLVIHPDVRGCGLGQFLVRKSLPKVGVKFVECLAAMGEFNPVFERAGMTRVGQVELSERQRAAMDALKSLDVDPNAAEFASHVACSPQVRHIVARVVYEWYAATTGGGRRRVERQSTEFLAQLFRGQIGTKPVYYLWERGKRQIVNTSKRQNKFTRRERLTAETSRSRHSAAV
ncbi:MAG: hypothetical protein HY287_12275 [Planctomycetes bacterium]|nr:hypothetical protein [Planctomycetota bacterium]MBI3835097.1 hypothetical protein [Planctomycetota bacterium]